MVTGGKLKFFSGEALRRVRGWEFDHLVVDEAAHIPDLETEWNLSLRSLLLKTQGTATFVSTPNGKNYFYSLFQKGLNLEDGFKSWQFSTHENPYIPKEELDFLERTMPQSAFKQEILAQPGENAANPFGTQFIDAATMDDLSRESTLIYGIDFGRVNDWTAIVGLDHRGRMSYFDRFKLSWEQTISKIKQLRERDPYTQMVVDSTGVGSVILERLQVEVVNVTGFEFTGKSKPIIIHNLIKDLELGNIKINKATAQEMYTFEFKLTSAGGIKYESAAGFHDDCIMALAMANYYKKNNSIQDTLFVY